MYFKCYVLYYIICIMLCIKKQKFFGAFNEIVGKIGTKTSTIYWSPL